MFTRAPGPPASLPDMRRLLAGLLALTALAAGAAPAAATVPRPAVLQLNLCNSGFAGCYATLNQGRSLDEAAALIRARRPAYVTLNEMCAGDLAKLRAATGYRGVFSQSGTQLCDPADHPDYTGEHLRYGNIVAAAPLVPVRSADDPVTYAGQEGLTEQRTVRCLRVWVRTRVCVTHLAANANAQGQAAELRGLLERWRADGPVILGGDLNLHPLGDGSAADGRATAPAGWSVADDGELMYVIASPPRRVLTPQVTPLAFTDHPALEAGLRPVRR